MLLLLGCWLSNPSPWGPGGLRTNKTLIYRLELTTYLTLTFLNTRCTGIWYCCFLFTSCRPQNFTSIKYFNFELSTELRCLSGKQPIQIFETSKVDYSVEEKSRRNDCSDDGRNRSKLEPGRIQLLDGPVTFHHSRSG